MSSRAWADKVTKGDPKVEISVNTENATAVVTISGRLDLFEGYELRDKIRGIFRNGCRSIVFDCRDVSYVDSTGLGLILQVSHWAEEHMGRAVVVSPSEAFSTVLSTMRLDRVIPVYESKEEALSVLSLPA